MQISTIYQYFVGYWNKIAAYNQNTNKNKQYIPNDVLNKYDRINNGLSAIMM